MTALWHGCWRNRHCQPTMLVIILTLFSVCRHVGRCAVGAHIVVRPAVPYFWLMSGVGHPCQPGVHCRSPKWWPTLSAEIDGSCGTANSRDHSGYDNLRQIFRIGTVRYAEGLWRMRRHGPVIAHCTATDSEDFPSSIFLSF